jgi:hypothetical protein
MKPLVLTGHPFSHFTKSDVADLAVDPRDRHAAYFRSRLSLTEFGKAIVAHQEDFNRHNPIDRWWAAPGSPTIAFGDGIAL